MACVAAYFRSAASHRFGHAPGVDPTGLDRVTTEALVAPIPEFALSVADAGAA